LHVYAAPILLSPKDNTEVDTSTPALTWQSTGATRYTVRGYDSTGKRVIYIAVNPDSGGSGCADGSGNCSKTYLSKPFADGIAKWQIQANNGEFSDFEYFMVNTETSIVDTQAPILTLHGDNPLNIIKGETFTDPGAIATDDRDGIVSRVRLSLLWLLHLRKSQPTVPTRLCLIHLILPFGMSLQLIDLDI